MACAFCDGLPLLFLECRARDIAKSDRAPTHYITTSSWRDSDQTYSVHL